MAGMLLALVKNKDSRALSEIFYSAKNTIEQAAAIQKVLSAGDSTEAYLSLENLNPADREQLKGVVLSPIGVVHLFRQYFFELDTFLGTPESHVWLSPGSSVELIEVHTRRQVVERTLETTLELLTRSEKSTTSEEEISEAVKQDNDQDIKFGASVKASYASIEATSSFDYANSQKMARREHPPHHAPADREALFRDPQEFQVHLQDRHRVHRRLQHQASSWRTPPTT